MSMGRVTCPLLWAAALGATKPYGVSLTTGGIAPASLRYNRLTPVVPVAGPCCLAGDPLLVCVPARLSSFASMGPVDVCHGSRCSLAVLGPAALEFRSCQGPSCSAGLLQCVRPWGCRLWCPVPLLPSVHVRVRCPGPRGACSLVSALCALCVCCWWLCPSSPAPLTFSSFLSLLSFALYLFCFVLPFYFCDFFCLFFFY